MRIRALEVELTLSFKLKIKSIIAQARKAVSIEERAVTAADAVDTFEAEKLVEIQWLAAQKQRIEEARVAYDQLKTRSNENDLDAEDVEEEFHWLCVAVHNNL